MTATLQFDPDEYTASAIERLLEAPEQWLPDRIESHLYWQHRYGWNQSNTYWGRYPVSILPITTNSSATCFICPSSPE